MPSKFPTETTAPGGAVFSPSMASTISMSCLYETTRASAPGGRPRRSVSLVLRGSHAHVVREHVVERDVRQRARVGVVGRIVAGVGHQGGQIIRRGHLRKHARHRVVMAV